MDNPTEEEIRRRREINMFASFALGGAEPIAGFDEQFEAVNKVEKADEMMIVESGNLVHPDSASGAVSPLQRGLASVTSPLSIEPSVANDDIFLKKDPSQIARESRSMARKRLQHKWQTDITENKNWTDFSSNSSFNDDSPFDKISTPPKISLAASKFQERIGETADKVDTRTTLSAASKADCPKDGDITASPTFAPSVSQTHPYSSRLKANERGRGIRDETASPDIIDSNNLRHLSNKGSKKNSFELDAWPKHNNSHMSPKDHEGVDSVPREVLPDASVVSPLMGAGYSKRIATNDNEAQHEGIQQDISNASNNFAGTSIAKDAWNKPAHQYLKRETAPSEHDVGHSPLSSDLNGTFLMDVLASPLHVDTGTFTFESKEKPDSNEQSNLDAAVAALSKSDKLYSGEDSSSKRIVQPTLLPKPLLDQKKLQQKVSPEPVCMFVEEISMPRPLFFGPMIPPRVLNEAREMLQSSIESFRCEQLQSPVVSSPLSPSSSPTKYNLNRPPKLCELPLKTRNVVGALRVFGYGLHDEVLSCPGKQSEDRSIHTSATTIHHGNSRVSTFQPVWGEDIRTERVKVVRKQLKKMKRLNRPKQLSGYDRSITAPARFLSTDPSEDDDLDDDNDFAYNISPNNAKGFYARKDFPGEGNEREREPKSSSKIINGDEIAEIENQVNQPVVPDESPDSLFSKWLRGDSRVEVHSTSVETGSKKGNRETVKNSNVDSDCVIKSKSWTTSYDNTFDETYDVDGDIEDVDDNSENDQGDLGETSNAALSIDVPLSEQELFSKWAMGSDTLTPSTKMGSVSFSRANKRNSNPGSKEALSSSFGSPTSNPMNTFQRTPAIDTGDRDSDEGSVIDDEQKKLVGVNDHLRKAIALLDEDELPSTNDVTTMEQSQVLISQISTDGNRKRPLTNFELTSGCVPMFGVDDSPLPQDSDLGIHETKEEQLRAQELKRSQDIIEKFVAPNVFGPVACPNNAVGPDDCHSWTSRAPTSPVVKFPVPHSSGLGNAPDVAFKRQFSNYSPSPSVIEPFASPGRENVRSRSEGNSVDFMTNPSFQQSKQKQSSQYRHHPKPPKHNGKKSVENPFSAAYFRRRGGGRRQIQPQNRVGWWSTTDGNDTDPDGIGEEDIEDSDDTVRQIPPLHHSSLNVQVLTHMEPTPEKLHSDNQPLSRMHAVSSMEQCLPYLSDRPHSYRYLQIDTQAIAFPPLQGEIEPLFCSISIYNVETIASTAPLASGSGGSIGSGAKSKASPIPFLQRCGRVTESLHFDHVADEEVAKRCSSSLYPHCRDDLTDDIVSGSNDHTTDFHSDEFEIEHLQRTTCGVFPLPSNLNLCNLFVILVVRKVISDESDMEPYVNPSSSGKNVGVDLNKHRAHAEKNSNHHGTFLMPFAFGVAPLLQVFGTDNPIVKSSRAVQIPLFLFEGKESQIIDHIMVMLFPKANHRAHGIGGAAAVSNGGTAMLVMRNFGYFGLHSVIDIKSPLFRDRVVDFTGELQIRRRRDDDIDDSTPGSGSEFEAYKVKLPDWRPEYICEPTKNGGRYLEETPFESMDSRSSKLYAQELLPVPLLMSPRLGNIMSPSIGRNQTLKDDIESYYHTSFCNELLCHPRILHNCPRMNVVIKVELREVEWNKQLRAYLAHLPVCGPRMHNNRRGPFLVQSLFTSCTTRRSHQFMDEFKIKLPLDLKPGRNLALFFTVFKIKLGSKGRWKRNAKLLFGSNETESMKAAEEHGVTGSTRLDQVACGFISLTTHRCLLENGIHDVPIVYNAFPLAEEFCNDGKGKSTSYLLKEILEETAGDGTNHIREDSNTDITAFSDQSFGSEIKSVLGGDAGLDLATLEENSQLQTPTKSKGTANEPISLAVRVVAYSSVHAQNTTLNDFLSQETDIPLLSHLPNKVFLSTLRMGRDYILNNSGPAFDDANTKDHTESLLETTIAITDHQLCSVSRSGSHIVRIMNRLWRSLICGTGDPNLAWANPGSSIPLRAHAFATIVHLVGATSLYLAKNGLSQLDGTSKWNVVTLGRVLALFFDEGSLFGLHASEKFDETYWSTPEALKPAQSKGSASTATKKVLPKPGRHFRSSYDLFNDIPNRDAPKLKSEIFASTAGDLATPPQKRSSVTQTPMLASQPDLSAIYQQDNASMSWERKVDSKKDFQLFLRAASEAADADVQKSESVEKADARHQENDAIVQSKSTNVKTFAQTFGEVASNRRWPPAAKSLLTIPESENGDDSDNEINGSDNDVHEDRHETAPLDLSTVDLIDDAVAPSTSNQTKQMRRPRLKPKQAGDSKQVKTDIAETIVSPMLLMSDDDIESKGNAFLADIGPSLGMSLPGEGDSVDSSQKRARRMQNRSSIDWSLKADTIPLLTSPQAQDATTFIDDSAGKEEDDESMSMLKTESTSYVKLPNFMDRLLTIGKLSSDNSRWFPYAYEVIIMQWAAILMEQRKTGEKAAPGSTLNPSSHALDSDLSQAALRSAGVAVASAPMLFEVIKKSLGFRVHALFNQVLMKKGSKVTPPLVLLDETLMSHLELVITMVTDACLDSRNFDSWDLLQMSIDVNDAIVRFLRDLFGFFEPSSVHKLALIHLSRFVTKEGKHVSDRDSIIGLRCSWEITKLRLNAVTAWARFPEFIKVNSPQMLNWSSWWNMSPRMNLNFFDNVLERYQALRLPAFASAEDGKSKPIDIPIIRPHWLAEIVVDACLLGTEHAFQYIQHRSASLLHELFWQCSQDSMLTGTSAPVASMFLSFLEKLLPNASYLANFSVKSQLRKDVLLCAIFVLQSTPTNLLRALWRQLILKMPGRDLAQKYFSDAASPDTANDGTECLPDPHNEVKEEPNILVMFSVLNLALRTIEYEGCDEHVESDSSGENRDHIFSWHREYLLCNKKKSGKESKEALKTADPVMDYTSTISRKWQAHDGSIVIVNTCHHIVKELFTLLHCSPSGKLLLNPAVQYSRQTSQSRAPADIAAKAKNFSISKAETILFVRAATSVYLHTLALRESDVVFVRTLIFSAEVIKIFGISVFLDAVGETLQHWMRVISFHCGARRAQVRIEATDLLELILRSSWECFGSFFRIRVPLLAVQTEVMERIVAIAASRYYREQRRIGTSFEAFSNLGAEASLVPLWRTLDRIEKQPASQNIAFRGALIRIARKLKKLYRAYVAARVLSFIRGSKERDKTDETEEMDYKNEAIVRANRINMLRVINASEGHSKQFLGFQGTAQQRISVAHFEAVEDALIDAADVFTPTELPEHRVAWLRMLAEFHGGRKKYAEEAMCHYHIHNTLNLAARLHGSLWSNTPFLPWTDNIPDPVVYIDGDATPTDPDCESEFIFEGEDLEYGKRMENANSFRRIFYRVANSIAMGNSDWDSGVTKNLFYGITLPYEYYTVSPWITLREMEETMTEEVEAAGHLFLSAGIVESSRITWNLVAMLHAEKFNYAKLSNAYHNLSKAVISQVPSVDTSLPQEVLTTLGRFYRVWFHGGAPDDLSGVEFVYRTQGSVPLKDFGEELHDVIKSIIPDRTPIHLVLDGLNDEKIDDGSTSYTGFRVGPAPLEPVRIKVTPLRPLYEVKTRGVPEWFNDYVDELYNGPSPRFQNQVRPSGNGRHRKDAAPRHGNDPHHNDGFRSFSATIFSSAGSGTTTLTGRRGPLLPVGNTERVVRFGSSSDSSLRGVDKFCFLQSRDRSKGSREWWKTSNGDFAEKSLKVTQLQVEQSFPACVARQAVVHRLVYAQSPLEAGVDAVCQWCAILFRTGVSTAGVAMLKTSTEPGIGTNPAKVVADCIHGSRVRDIGLALLKKESEMASEDNSTDFTFDYDRLSQDEVKKFQRKLSRLIVTFIELLHLLIAQNRDLLLSTIRERKKNNELVGSLTVGTVGRISSSSYRQKPILATDGMVLPERSESRSSHKPSTSDDQQSYQSVFTAAGVRTDNAIAVQSELQRALIKLVKDLYPRLQGILQSETPRWLKECTLDNYFSNNVYQQTKVRIAEELNFLSMLDTTTTTSGGGQSGDGADSTTNSQQNFESHMSQSDQASVAAGSHTSAISRTSTQHGMT